MNLFYFLIFTFIKSSNGWFFQKSVVINPTIPCVKYLKNELSVYNPPTTGNDWNLLEFESNIGNINCAVVYEKSNRIVFVDNNFNINSTKQNIHHMNILPYMNEKVLQQLEENSAPFYIEGDYPQPHWILSWGYYLITGLFRIYWYIFLMRIFLFLFFYYRSGSKLLEPTTSIYEDFEYYGSDTGKNETDENDTMFEDVAGCDEAKQELQEVIEFLKNPEEFEEAGAKIPAGVLLEGPPGTGKTMLARATANEAEVSFLYATGSEFIEKYVGVGAKRVRKLFESAKKKKPCIIFIDEIDAIGGSRSNSRNDERDQTLNQLLTLMDGFKTRDGIIVLAATNRSEVLDRALVRSGRFDRKVTVGLPDKKGRQQILDVHLKNKFVEKKCNMESIYELTTGFSGAELSTLANEAAILSVRYKLSRINDKCLIDAFEKNTIGLPKREDNRPKENIKMVAYHEAGHTIAALFFNHIFDVRRVTINANNTGAGGYTLFTPKEEYVQFPTKRYMLANLIISLGGRAAEIVLYQEKDKKQYIYDDTIIFNEHLDLDITTGASNDLKQANRLARGFITKYGLGENIGIYDNSEGYDDKMSDNTKQRIDGEIEMLVKTALKMALRIIQHNRSSLDKISELLINFITVKEEQLKEKIHIKHDILNDISNKILDVNTWP
jgi:cell division protease FtsH